MKPAAPWRRLAVALLALASFGGAGAARAQGWSASVAAGRIVHEGLGDRLGTAGTTLGLAYDGPRWLYLTGGVPFDTDGVVWGALGAGGRLATGERVALGVDVASHLYGFRDRAIGDDGTGLTLEAMPLLSVGSRRTVLGFRSGIRYYASGFAGETESRRIHQTDARLTFAEAGMRITAEGRFARAEERDYPYAGGEVELAVGRGALWGVAGKWLVAEIDTPTWGAGVALPVGNVGELFASVQQETNDPLYRQTPRRSWSLGVSRAIGGASARAADPVLLPLVQGDRVTFRLPAADAGDAPSIGGDFTEWQAVPMTRDGDHWTVTLPVPSGAHRYAFRGPDGEWFVPESVPGRVDDGFGGYSATVVVP